MWTLKDLTDRLYGEAETAYETEARTVMGDEAADGFEHEMPAYNSGKDYGVLGVAVPGVTVH